MNINQSFASCNSVLHVMYGQCGTALWSFTFMLIESRNETIFSSIQCDKTSLLKKRKKKQEFNFANTPKKNNWLNGTYHKVDV